MNKRYRPIAGAVIVALGLIACGLNATAQTRKTPVEVKNPVQIDSTANTVKVDPANNTVKVDPANNTVKIDGTTNTVKAAQSGTWNVGITGTPTVSIGNTASVQIDPFSTSTVTTKTQSKGVKIWPSNFDVAAGATVMSSGISCAGYKELRVVMRSTLLSTSVKCGIGFLAPSNIGYTLGEFSFATSTTNPFTTQGGFVQSNYLIFTFPVMGDTCYFYIRNAGTILTTMFADECWVYMVN